MAARSHCEWLSRAIEQRTIFSQENVRAMTATLLLEESVSQGNSGEKGAPFMENSLQRGQNYGASIQKLKGQETVLALKPGECILWLQGERPWSTFTGLEYGYVPCYVCKWFFFRDSVPVIPDDGVAWAADTGFCANESTSPLCTSALFAIASLS